MVKDEVPVKSVIEDFRHDPQWVTQVCPEDIYRYRAGGSGQWVHEGWDGEVHVDDFSSYTCPEHTGEHDRLMGLAYTHHLAQEETTPPLPGPASMFAQAMKDLEQTAQFAAGYYGKHRVPPEALRGLNLRACRCPKCRKGAVFVMDTYVPGLYQFQGLLSLLRHRSGQTVMNHCGRCGEVVNRKVVGETRGVSVPGDLVTAWMTDRRPG